MSSIIAWYPGFVAVMFVYVAFIAHKLPRFRTEAFLARPPEERLRSIRKIRILAIVAAVLALAIAVAIGVAQGYVNAKLERSHAGLADRHDPMAVFASR